MPAEEAQQVLRYYGLRWRIEDYHKAWKSGVGVERQRFQTVDNLERRLVITAFLAVITTTERTPGCPSRYA